MSTYVRSGFATGTASAVEARQEREGPASAYRDEAETGRAQPRAWRQVANVKGHGFSRAIKASNKGLEPPRANEDYDGNPLVHDRRSNGGSIRGAGWL